MKSQLQVYARLKPTDNASIAYEIDKSSKRLTIGQKYNKAGFINNMKETMDFNFTDILDINATQEQVFQQVAVPVVLNCLDGYNGTIFAYGQTGSGKTYTINGSDSWAYRGIIPRVMTYIFDQIDERKNDYEYTVYASYMEIYNEKAYDLLNEDHLVSPIEQWNKIEFKRDNLGNIHLNNISLHEIDDAKPGIDLLMMGNYIRKQAATPMNQCSSRSHCIFTLTFEARQIETNTCFVSKLNLVDLAGSERVSKTNHDGTLLNEAKNINLSLSYLEQVIVALNEKKKTGQRQHIPYRHSILTTILKDSLGGNCKTVMIANISTELDNFEETISALRFSQRVGQLENEIHKNQKLDLNSMVEKLEQEKQQLLDELQKYQKIVGELKDSENAKNANLQNKNQKRSSQQYQSKQTLFNNDESQEEIEIDEEQDLDQILTKVDEYMQDKIDQLEVKNMVEAKLCFRAMKEYHKSTMADYLKELSDISKKLQQYDALLPQVSKKKESIPQIKDSDITQMALNNFYHQKQQSNRQSINDQPYHDENVDPETIQKGVQYTNQQHQPVVFNTHQQYIPSQMSQAALVQNQQLTQDGYIQKQEIGNRKKKQQSFESQNQPQQQQVLQTQNQQSYQDKNYASKEELEINLYKQQYQNSLQRKQISQHALKSKNENMQIYAQQSNNALQQNQYQQDVRQDHQRNIDYEDDY
ncbi:kinesin motor catalytic domain protein (macronuclear) [Tetrahymena thermophila SB210]|uniref:Kinesin-like protein n=1 Tax=Tetrahymena thermophila (strain SB210) TaxID=312017 RepID=Q23W24_TETTS|nr:kinesin motor catalytic domain protein [Tetrahymena thermophila SB210]EAS00681.2 kinesin motor catalytic domain protein [Tetrahymena thermophila SB210]|eukprot:XP_001020926.2 kinesin motor catalytic domain protein [Tetrahymena thermophila SB210]